MTKLHLETCWRTTPYLEHFHPQGEKRDEIFCPTQIAHKNDSPNSI